jgi:hypothetical protein
MAIKGIRELFGDILVDPELRAKLVLNTEETVRDGNYDLDGDEMDRLKQIVSAEDLSNLSIEELDERIALCGRGEPNGPPSGPPNI